MKDKMESFDSSMRGAVLALAGAIALSGCALPGIFYTNVTGPFAYRSAAPGDVKAKPTDPVVRGKSCQRSIFFLTSWGDSGYGAAVQNAMKGRPDDEVLYDVKCDASGKVYFFGVYSELCTIVTGKAGKTQ